ncbi:MAG: VanZ family protein, partial [Desulfobacterales bacterium]
MFLPAQDSGHVGQTGTRLAIEIWITGHILVFFLGCYLFYSFNPGFKNRPASSQILLVLLATLAASLAIEGAQALIPGRYPAVRDMAGNFAGCLLYLSFIHRRPSVKLLPLHAATIALTAVLLYPVFISIADRAVANTRFPVLADFETPMEKTRFRGNRSLLEISDKYVFQGDHSLRM